MKKITKKNVPADNDWRRQGQENYLKEIKLVLKNYYPYRIGWDHDHCEFCGKKFSLMDGDLQKGYTTVNGYHWVCVNCFIDFKDEFNWLVEDSDQYP